jgi:hypothetical protein
VERYATLERRASPDGRQTWLNRAVRLPSGDLAGYVQATVLRAGAALIAYELASLPIIFARAVRRTVVRSVFQERKYAGNRESLRRAFFTRESILLWVLTTYWERRRRYPILRASPNYAGLAWFELKRPADVAAFLGNVRVAALPYG